MTGAQDVVPADEVRRAIGDSELIGGLSRARGRLAGARPLTEEEVALLERAGNSCSDWSNVSVGELFDARFVRGCMFLGRVKIGATGTPTALAGASAPSGAYDSVVADSVICDGALVMRVGLLSKMIVEPGAVVANCSEVACSAGTTFGNGLELPVAIETGGREVAIYAEITIPVAAAVAGRRDDVEMLTEYAAAVADYAKAATSDVGVVCEGARVLNTPVVRDAFIGPHALVDGAAWVENVTVLSNAEEIASITSGAHVKDSLVQWGCEVATTGIVLRSAMTEHSHVERQGRLSDSIVGPNTGLAQGEATACLLGPFIGFHHQALLIAAYWPEGKGNVSSGANVGSNHPSRAPDQEIWPGEGTFFGLGVHIKFPTDLSRAPYSIIATGVTALPQKVSFPFSRIDVPTTYFEGIYPAYNEIVPGWVLSDNIYSVRRNEEKYKKRDRSRRSKFVFDVLRPDTVDLMLDARSRLQAAGGKDVYVEADVAGLGKNFMVEKSRLAGIEAYTFYIRYYALMGLKRVLEAGADPAGILERLSPEEPWEHQRGIIASEFPGEDGKSLLGHLVEAQRRIAGDVLSSKMKDDVRGVRVIDDYASAHTAARDDGLVVRTQEETKALEAEVRELLAKIRA